MEPKNLPIGYWIKQADNLLTEGINNIHAANGINRTEWQILHLLQEQKAYPAASLITIMQPFGDSAFIEEILERLIAKNLVQRPADNVFSLTAKGNELHARCFQHQQEFRRKIMKNVSTEDYSITVKTLKAMVANISAHHK